MGFYHKELKEEGGKKFIPKVKALLNIPNVVDAGKIYQLKQLKGEFPYIDFNNEEYFEQVFDTAKFAVGSKVRYTGYSSTHKHSTTPSNKVTYKVTKVIPQVKGNLVYYTYDIVGSDEHIGIAESHTVKESELAEACDKWIVSFSQSNLTEMPAIHQLGFYAFEHKIMNTWKELFVFDTFEEAQKVAKAIAKFGIKKMVDYISNRPEEYNEH